MATWPTAPGTVFFGAGHRPASLTAAVKAGRLIRIRAGLYATPSKVPVEKLVLDNRYMIIGGFIPDAVLTDRSAGPTPVVDGRVFVASASRTADLQLPALTVKVRDGVALPSDLPWHGIKKASLPRTVLDNLSASSSRTGPARTFTTAELTDWLARRAALIGQTVLDRIGEELEEVGTALGYDDATIGRARQLVDGVAGRVPLPCNAGRAAVAFTGGADPSRVEMFDVLAAHLDGLDDLVLDVPPSDGRTLPFYEAYFSNFIEGTEFTLEEAELIISGQGPTVVERPEDAHDVLSTFQLVADPVGQATVPQTADDFIDLLQTRHETLMSARHSVQPGVFRTKDNRVGMWTFVTAAQVAGTLHAGWDAICGVRPGWPRALMTMFVVAEVHPFNDGNGRMARIMANAELSKANQSRLIIPTIWRDEYLVNLQAMSRDRTLAGTSKRWRSRGAGLQR